MPKERTKKTALARSVLPVVVAATCVAILYFATHLQSSARKLYIGNQELNVKIATTSQQKQRGLCCRDSLPINEGMLFVYNSPGLYAFWMKDTKIPLDMFWISSDKHIVHIEKNVQPGTYPKTYVSSQPAQYVLETNAGYASRYHIKNRDKVAF